MKIRNQQWCFYTGKLSPKHIKIITDKGPMVLCHVSKTTLTGPLPPYYKNISFSCKPVEFDDETIIDMGDFPQ